MLIEIKDKRGRETKYYLTENSLTIRLLFGTEMEPITVSVFFLTRLMLHILCGEYPLLQRKEIAHFLQWRMMGLVDFGALFP